MQNPLEHPYTRFVWLKELPEEKLRPLTYACLANAKSMTPSLTHLLGIGAGNAKDERGTLKIDAEEIINRIVREGSAANFVVTPLPRQWENSAAFIANVVPLFHSSATPRQKAGIQLIIVSREKVEETKEALKRTHVAIRAAKPQNEEPAQPADRPQAAVLTVDDAIALLAQRPPAKIFENGVTFGIIDDSHTVEKIKGMALAIHIPQLVFIGRKGPKDQTDNHPLPLVTFWLENNATIYMETEMEENQVRSTGPPRQPPSTSTPGRLQGAKEPNQWTRYQHPWRREGPEKNKWNKGCSNGKNTCTTNWA